MATVTIPKTHRLVLYGESWQTYIRLSRVFDERRAVRITYDRGALEIMTLGPEHESCGSFLGRLVVTLTEELRLPIKEGGSMTMRRRRLKRGLEPDRCYWIASEPQVRGKLHIDFRIDPPPNLAIEIDVSRSSLNRLGIYAALRVPEVWRFDGRVLTFHVLGADGKYHVQGQSLAFPLIMPADLVPFVAIRAQMDENEVIAQFRVWIRARLAAGGPPPPGP